MGFKENRQNPSLFGITELQLTLHFFLHDATDKRKDIVSDIRNTKHYKNMQ